MTKKMLAPTPDDRAGLLTFHQLSRGKHSSLESASISTSHVLSPTPGHLLFYHKPSVAVGLQCKWRSLLLNLQKFEIFPVASTTK